MAVPGLCLYLYVSELCDVMHQQQSLMTCSTLHSAVIPHNGCTVEVTVDTCMLMDCCCIMSLILHACCVSCCCRVCLPAASES